jgi:hypothetical protein
MIIFALLWMATRESSLDLTDAQRAWVLIIVTNPEAK